MTARRRHVGVNETIRYGYALGRVRALEAKLLSESTFRRLLSPPVLGEQKRVLSDTVYGGILDDAITADDVERAFSKELLAIYADFLEGARVPEPVLRFFRSEIELEEERLSLKRAAHERDDSESPITAVAAIPGAATESIGDVDAHIDARRLISLREAAADSGVGMLHDLVERMIDHANLKTVMRTAIGARGVTPEIRERAAESLIEGGSASIRDYRELLFAPNLDPETLRSTLPWTRDLDADELLDRSAIDVALKRREVDALREAAATPTGADPVIVYVLRRRIEIETLRSIIVATIAGADPGRLEKRIAVVS